MDWITRTTIADNRRGNLKIVLKDVNFADDIALLSSKFKDLRDKTWRLTEEAARVDLMRESARQ